jgi:hypothetical protein
MMHDRLTTKERLERQLYGWEETESKIKEQYIAMDEAFCLAMWNAMAMGLERARG